MRPADQFHVGIVVDDLDRALGDLSARFGYRWADEIHVDQPVQLPHGTATVEFRFRYSRDAPRLEIIEARPGTLWVPARDSGIHHLGYWSDDIAAARFRGPLSRQSVPVAQSAAMSCSIARSTSSIRGPFGERWYDHIGLPSGPSPVASNS